MITQEFFDLLEKNPDKLLKFEYQPGRFVESNFHITEVKNVKIDSVDCGGAKNGWNETVLQLWNPSKPSERYPMKGDKALNILSTVDNIDPIDRDAELYFEYGNQAINVSNFEVQGAVLDSDSLTIRFNSQRTQCKAADRVTDSNSSCCGPSRKEASSVGEAAVSCCG